MTDERAPEGAPEPNAETTGATPAAEDATSPTIPAYTPPAYTPPPVPPPAMAQPAMAQPAVAWAPPPASAPAKGKRTSLSLAAGILLLILGILGGLIALLIITVGREFAQQFNFANLPGFEGGDPSAIVGSVVTFVGIVLLVFSTFYIVGGVGVMRSANWGRVIGIIVGILATLFWLASFASTGQVGSTSGRQGGEAFALVLLVVHLYIAVVLLFFWRTRASSA
jgi:hypothetical protein